MKLSEAMARGWVGIEQCVAVLQETDAHHRVVAACALGAAFRGVSDQYVEDPDRVTAEFPQLYDLIDPEATVYGKDAYQHWGDTPTGKVRLLEFVYYLNDTASLTKDLVIAELEELGY